MIFYTNQFTHPSNMDSNSRYAYLYVYGAYKENDNAMCYIYNSVPLFYSQLDKYTVASYEDSVIMECLVKMKMEISRIMTIQYKDIREFFEYEGNNKVNEYLAVARRKKINSILNR